MQVVTTSKKLNPASSRCLVSGRPSIGARFWVSSFFFWGGFRLVGGLTAEAGSQNIVLAQRLSDAKPN